VAPSDGNRPLERALPLARALRETFGLDALELEFLLKRWRDLDALPLGDDHLALLARLVATDAPEQPLTREEVREALADCAAFHGPHRVDEARRQFANYLALRGASPAQQLRADAVLVRRLARPQGLAA
jgi:hypothetical protein